MSMRNVKICQEFCQDIFDYMFYSDLPTNRYNHKNIGLDMINHIYNDKQRLCNYRFNDMISVIRDKGIIAINNAVTSLQTNCNTNGIYVGKSSTVSEPFGTNLFYVGCALWVAQNIDICIVYNVDNYKVHLTCMLCSLSPIINKYCE